MLASDYIAWKETHGIHAKNDSNKVKVGDRVVITNIQMGDAFYRHRHEIIGQQGIITEVYSIDNDFYLKYNGEWIKNIRIEFDSPFVNSNGRRFVSEWFLGVKLIKLI